MNNVVVINNIHGYSDEKGIAWLAVKDLAMGLGLGFKQVKNGKTYEAIRWNRMENYLKAAGFDFLPRVAENEDWKDAYIPENIVYKLLMKVDNEAAKPFQDLVCDDILPSIRRTGTYTTPQIPQIPKTPAQIAVDEITAVTSAAQQIMTMIPSMKNDMAVITAVDIMKPATTHIDTGIIIRALPARNVADAGTYNATDMGNIIGNKSARVINQALADLGFQTKTNKNWKLTECGTDYGEMIPFGAGKYAGFKITWNEKALDALKKYFNVN